MASQPGVTPTVRPLRAYMAKQYHKDFKTTTDQIHEALEKANISKKSAQPYEKVAVLLFHWDDTSSIPSIPRLEDELAATFQDIYNFTVERYIIDRYDPAGKPLRVLSLRLAKFRTDHEAPNNLLIAVYSGHAYTDVRATVPKIELHGEPKIPGTVCAPDEMINWGQVNVNLAIAQCDRLLIFDACYAAGIAVDGQGTEVLAAAAMETKTTSDKDKNLTNRFNNLLKRHAGAPMSVAQLHGQLMNGIIDPPTYLNSTPVYVDAVTRPSAILASLDSRKREKAMKQHGPPKSNARVLVKIDLQGQATLPNVNEFVRYLTTNIPSSIADVSVEACFASDSSVMLVSMPVEVWDVLSEDSAIEFVSHVNSKNIMLDA